MHKNVIVEKLFSVNETKGSVYDTGGKPKLSRPVIDSFYLRFFLTFGGV